MLRERSGEQRQLLVSGAGQWVVPQAYGTLLQISEDGQAISRRPDGSLELLRFDPSGLATPTAEGVTATLPVAWIRQRHALRDLVEGEPVLAAHLQRNGALTWLDLVTG